MSSPKWASSSWAPGSIKYARMTHREEGIIHPEGVAGFNDADPAKLAEVFVNTTGHGP